ncbi:MAG: hypothetical protein K8T89_02405 [Planctomycetes bacterium]|nr:hypothetical protein [Planctomycetota bacterium]
MPLRIGLVLIIGAILSVPPKASACSIPVFRYALERWQATPYDVLIYHRGPLSVADRKAIQQVEVVGEKANLEVTEIDLTKKNGKELTAIWEKYGTDNPLPWMIIRYPDSDANSPPAWSGPVDAVKLKPFIDSPFRQRIIRKLFNGDSAIVVLLESGDKKADDEAAKILTTSLTKFEKDFELPKLTREGPQLRSEVPLNISLPMVRLSRDQAEEKQFIDTMVRSQEGLDKAKGPIAFVIFGRGRLLTALHGKDLNAANVESVARFLCGACSCQVKELNPGVDLVFHASWELFMEVELVTMPREAKTPAKLEKR